jgi:PAS domain S-box-containing protein
MDSTIQSKQYKQILDSLSEGVCTISHEWRVTTFNLQAQKLFGVSEEHAVGKLFGDLFFCEICECRNILSGVMTQGKAVRDVATRIITPEGQQIPVLLNAAPFLNGNHNIEGMVVSFRDIRPLETLRRELRHSYNFQDMISRNSRMQRIFNILPTVAQSDSSVVILGESGTGKELLARAIHQASRRSQKPFIALNCGALPDNLLESELFGYKKGAFTDARSDKAGRFELAEGGTIFLDEIGDTTPAMQIKLLRVLQEREFEPLGATHSIKTNIRLITATNRDLRACVENGTFRADLFYRINVINFELPSLAERAEDIPLLVEHFIEVLNAETGRDIQGVEHNAIEHLIRYNFPGNIRELRNIIERAYVLCNGREIREQCLPPHVLNVEPHKEPAAAETPTGQFINLRRLDPQSERQLILETLQKCAGNRKNTASQLGVNPATLWRKMKKHNML